MMQAWKALNMEEFTALEAVIEARRKGDNQAKYLLRQLAVSVYDEIENPATELLKCRAVTVLVHAEIYLGDRLLYQLYPPPNKLATLVESEASK